MYAEISHAIKQAAIRAPSARDRFRENRFCRQLVGSSGNLLKATSTKTKKKTFQARTGPTVIVVVLPSRPGMRALSLPHGRLGKPQVFVVSPLHFPAPQSIALRCSLLTFLPCVCTLRFFMAFLLRDVQECSTLIPNAQDGATNMEIPNIELLRGYAALSVAVLLPFFVKNRTKRFVIRTGGGKTSRRSEESCYVRRVELAVALQARRKPGIDIRYVVIRFRLR